MLYTISYLSYFKIFFVAILLYVIIFALLKKLEIFGKDNNVYALISLLSVIIVSFSGVLTYTVTYAVNLFSILLVLFFLIFVLANFLGVKGSEVSSIFTKNSKIVIIVLAIIFALIFFKSFFALNNTFENPNQMNNSYNVSTTTNFGTGEIIHKNSFWDRIQFDSGVLPSALFLLVVGVFVIFLK